MSAGIVVQLYGGPHDGAWLEADEGAETLLVDGSHGEQVYRLGPARMTPDVPFVWLEAHHEEPDNA